jgi:diaminohydroxyphosphoribosylaminopyrimidine deaminase / 5-amino-6-(5-phosphoribosylamino)uracil reductase
MRRALLLAERGRGCVQPNPLVGAVVTDAAGYAVGEGWHAEYGGPHAELVALRAAGSAAAGGTLYVTLEPCAHHGRTPPCTDAILAAGIRRVVFAAADPNPVAAGGAALLRAAGVDVVGGVENDAARVQNRIFFHIHEQRRCYVALKLAITLDARLGVAGERTRLTGDAANAATQRLRAGFDALLVGSATAHIDDPLLTVRGVAVRVPPRRVVLDSDAGLRIDSTLLRTLDAAPAVVVCATDAPAARVAALRTAGAVVLQAARSESGLALDDVLARLWLDGVHSVLCEGGGRLAASLLRAGLVDRLHLLVAPLVLGDAGVPAFPLPDGCPPGRWRLEEVQRLGDDVALEYAPASARQA